MCLDVSINLGVGGKRRRGPRRSYPDDAVERSRDQRIRLKRVINSDEVKALSADGDV